MECENTFSQYFLFDLFYVSIKVALRIEPFGVTNFFLIVEEHFVVVLSVFSLITTPCFLDVNVYCPL